MKKRLKTIVAAATLLVMTGSVLIGCSNSNTQNGKVKLDFLMYKPEAVNTFKDIIKDFQNKNPNIEVTLNSPPQAETVLKTRLTKNDIPDIIGIGGDSYFQDLSKAGVLKDLSSESIAQQSQSSYVNILKSMQGKDNADKLFAVPFAGNADAVIYNKDIFKELNLQIPQTWDEFVKVADKVKSAGKTPFTFTFKDSWTTMPIWNPLAVNIAPANIYSQVNDGKTTFKQAYSEAADKILTLSKYATGDVFGIGYNDGNIAFAQGKSAMYFQGSWAIPEIVKANPNINIGMFVLPATNDVSKNKLISGVDLLFSVSNTSKHSKEAIKFIEFLMQKENAEKYVKQQYAIPGMKSVTEYDSKLADLTEAFKQNKIADFADHSYPTSMQTADMLQGYLHNSNKDEFLSNFDKQWNNAKAQ